jgi:hypothetical protein
VIFSYGEIVEIVVMGATVHIVKISHVFGEHFRDASEVWMLVDLEPRNER